MSKECQCILIHGHQMLFIIYVLISTQKYAHQIQSFLSLYLLDSGAFEDLRTCYFTESEGECVFVWERHCMADGWRHELVCNVMRWSVTSHTDMTSINKVTSRPISVTSRTEESSRAVVWRNCQMCDVTCWCVTSRDDIRRRALILRHGLTLDMVTCNADLSS